MFSIGYDIGSSSVKCCIWDVATSAVVASGQYPETEMEITSPQPGWAEQDPQTWWEHVQLLTRRLVGGKGIRGDQVGAIGIAYQMHGLVIVDSSGKVLRPAIIWCDSRAVEVGEGALQGLGREFCMHHLLNAPGNFTASKLRWVRDHEPRIYSQIHKAMLPGDYIAMKLTGEVTTTVSGLSEGIFWDYIRSAPSSELLQYYDVDERLLADIKPTFGVQGRLTHAAAAALGLHAGIPIAYRAGDPPNNAFSLNVLNPGEVAATAGTSGVIFAVTGALVTDPDSRVNVFAHVNHEAAQTRLGILLCVNGTGILNSWLRKNVVPDLSYDQMNVLAAKSPIGAAGLQLFPFGNGAERMFSNATLGCHMAHLDFTRHTRADLLRAAQEGVAFSFAYGADILSRLGVSISVVRAGYSNMFLSPLFSQTVATVLGSSVELYGTDGAQGAARGAALGSGMYHSFTDAFDSFEKKGTIDPAPADAPQTSDAYLHWVEQLKKLF
jgi:xylulokinase